MGRTEVADLIPRVERWIAHDPDTKTRAEIEGFLANNDVEELLERFQLRLKFGTAGIRGAQGGGPNRMNRVTIRRVAVGVAKYLEQGQTVIIGYDARVNSRIFAEDFSLVLSLFGINSKIFSSPVPTPVLAFSVRRLRSDLGVMITASHNPATDNGCKIFLSDGAQLREPEDGIIDAHIVEADFPPRIIEQGKGKIERVGSETWAAYCSDISKSVPQLSDLLTIAYTPLHGVAWATVKEVFSLTGVSSVVVVPSQAQPDSDFPTTPFPNPEEKGSMDEVLEVANAIEADLVLANDPDGDRLAVGISTSAGNWRILTGDEIGALLCNRMTQITSGRNRKVVSTVVCSSLVGKIAVAAGVSHSQTLTGFKWIIPEAYKDPAWTPIFAYEEALGYAVTDLVRDKDGISAALRFTEMVIDLKKKGMTVLDQLNKISLEHGLHVTRSVGVRFEGIGAFDRAIRVVESIRTKPPKYLAGLQTLEVNDFDSVSNIGGLPPSGMTRLLLEDGVRILIRPSGTESVVKIYIEQVVVVDDESRIEGERRRIQRKIDHIVGDLDTFFSEVN
ncbi:MAG: phospho-sugar mutase [Acidimicrobiales bacterium]|nr:phospho-sugar mutase [Acidimicrobiales bacterium]